MSLTNANAAYAFEMRWFSDYYCGGAPDLIVNTSASDTMALNSELVLTGVGYCGNSFLVDCSSPGFCMSSLDTSASGTDGIESYADSYLAQADGLSKDLAQFSVYSNGLTYCAINMGSNAR